MTTIGLFSDTHSHLDSKIQKHFLEVNEIWHAGDVGKVQLIHKIESWEKPIRGVYGNIDNHEVRAIFPLDNRFELEGFDIWITHIGGYPGRYSRRVWEILQTNPPDIFVCGHSHILRVMRDKKYNNMWILNPGGCGAYSHLCN